MSKPSGYLAVTLTALLLALRLPLEAQSSSYQHGDVFVSIDGGQVARFSQNGRLREVLRNGTKSVMGGICFDLKANLYSMNFEAGTMSAFDSRGRLTHRSWGGPFSGNPESCVADAAGHIYAGEVDGRNILRKFDARGRLLDSYRLAPDVRGIDWIDLAADQCTMFYTSEGSRVKRYDVCRKRQLPDFATDLAAPCYALRLRENGEVLVTCENRVYRLNTQGRQIRTYDIRQGNLFSMNLDPDGVHFWVAPMSGEVYKVNIETGQGTQSPLFSSIAQVKRKPSLWEVFGVKVTTVGGLAIYGERTAAIAEEARKLDPREIARKKAEEEARKRAEEARRQAEEEARRKAQEEARRQAEEEARRQAAEETRKKAEEDARRKAEEEARQQAEEEARRQAEEEARRLAEEEARWLAEEEARWLAEEEARRKAEEDARRKAEEDARRRAEEGARRRRGKVTFGPASSLDFGELAAGDVASAVLDLDGTRLEGRATGTITSSLDVAGVAFEIETDDGWQELGPRPLDLPIEQDGRRTWPLRLRVSGCAPGIPASGDHSLVVEAPGLAEPTVRRRIPIAVTVVKSHWLDCWWPILASVLGACGAVGLIYGFIVPARFPPRLGVVLSPEEDMSEGFFHPIRRQRGSGAGFYRDARVYISADFRIHGRPAGALVRLRAGKRGAYVKPMHGALVWRQTLDGDWEQLPAQETRARPGTVYRDDLKTLFFELRNG